MSIGFLIFVRYSLSFLIVVAIASSSRILFSNFFIPLLITTGSRLKYSAVDLNGRLANSFPKYPTTEKGGLWCRNYFSFYESVVILTFHSSKGDIL